MTDNTFYESMRDLALYQNPYTLAEEVAKAGYQWSDAEAGADALEETKKSMLASITLEYITNGTTSGAAGQAPKKISKIEAETHAQADPRYAIHLDMMVDARRQANKARVRYDMGRVYLDLLRSANATLRTELKG